MKKLLASAVLTTALAAPAFADVLPPPPTEVYTPQAQTLCTPFNLNVYFQPGESVLNQHSLNTLQAATERVQGCAISSLSLISLAADATNRAPQEDLAAERLNLVHTALISQGISAEETSKDITALPVRFETEPPMARRVEITVAAYRPEIG